MSDKKTPWFRKRLRADAEEESIRALVEEALALLGAKGHDGADSRWKRARLAWVDRARAAGFGGRS